MTTTLARMMFAVLTVMKMPMPLVVAAVAGRMRPLRGRTVGGMDFAIQR
jgi:hypothetical protein